MATVGNAGVTSLMTRKRLLDLLRRRPESEVLLVSGDRHIGGVYQIEYAGERFTEITSSGLNMAWTRSDEYLKPVTKSGCRYGRIILLWFLSITKG